MDGRISTSTRWTLIGAVACLSFVAFVGTAARILATMTSPSSVQQVGKPGQLLVLRTHPLLPPLTVDATTGKGSAGTIRIGLTY